MSLLDRTRSFLRWETDTLLYMARGNRLAAAAELLLGGHLRDAINNRQDLVLDTAYCLQDPATLQDIGALSRKLIGGRSYSLLVSEGAEAEINLGLLARVEHFREITHSEAEDYLGAARGLYPSPGDYCMELQPQIDAVAGLVSCIRMPFGRSARQLLQLAEQYRETLVRYVFSK